MFDWHDQAILPSNGRPFWGMPAEVENSITGKLPRRITLKRDRNFENGGSRKVDDRMNITRICAAIVIAALWPLGLIAEEDPACAYGDPTVFAGRMDGFTGEWQMHHLTGYMSLNGQLVMPLRADPTPAVVTMFRMDSGLVANFSPEIPPVDLEWAEEPVWNFQREADQTGVPEPFFTSTDIEMLMGCSNDRMARLIGKVSVDLDGDPMDVTFRLMVLNDDTLYGIQHNHIMGSDGTVDIWGSIKLSR